MCCFRNVYLPKILITDSSVYKSRYDYNWLSCQSWICLRANKIDRMRSNIEVGSRTGWRFINYLCGECACRAEKGLGSGATPFGFDRLYAAWSNDLSPCWIDALEFFKNYNNRTSHRVGIPALPFKCKQRGRPLWRATEVLCIPQRY